MGSASGGGSGRMAEYTLPHSGLRLTLCQMASFAADGQTYDGNGVQPDIVLPASLQDQIRDGGDSVLDAAVKRLLAGPPSK
jgi:C-terminal processing protease CtpA/Prc